jgi:hypothetical protein
MAGTAAVCTLGLPAIAQASLTYTVPAGLTAGDTYRLVFVTSSTTDGTSTDITTYNTMAQSADVLNATLPSATWYVIGSTSATTAATNISCGGNCATDPIYLVTGTEIATSQSNLLNGNLLSAIDLDENGNTPPNTYGSYVYTGTDDGGTADTYSPLGGSTYSIGGDYTSTEGASLQDIYLAHSYYTSIPIYAISGEITVPGGMTSTPEPMSLSLLLAGGAMTGVARRLKRKRRQMH